MELKKSSIMMNGMTLGMGMALSIYIFHDILKKKDNPWDLLSDEFILNWFTASRAITYLLS